MLDLNFIRENKEKVREALKVRAPKLDFEGFLLLDQRRRELLKEIEDLRAQKNKSNEIVTSLLKDKKDAKDAIGQMKTVSQKIDLIEKEVGDSEAKVRDILMVIPNIPHESVQHGTDASGNVVYREWGVIPTLDKPKDHVEISQKLGLFDLSRGAKISGSGFILYGGGAGAKLQRSLINFFLDVHTTQHGYTEFWPPLLVNRATMTATGQLPKFEEDMYKLQDEDLFLIPTAEVPLTNIHRDEMLKEDDMPLKYTAYTPCFRREAGSYGKDTKGLTRVHQFDKVELVKFTKAEESYAEHEKMLEDAERIMKLLKLPYRVLRLCSGDMGFGAAKCYDIEVWAPGTGRWLEVSSVSNFEAFQARRGNIRYKRKDTGKTELVHTLNGSGLALPRIVIAILENYQNPDGSVNIPDALKSYMGVDVIK